MPPLAPPKGTSTMAHLNVISVANAVTSSKFTALEKRMPPFVGIRWREWWTRYPVMISVVPSLFSTGNVKVIEVSGALMWAMVAGLMLVNLLASSKYVLTDS